MREALMDIFAFIGGVCSIIVLVLFVMTIIGFVKDKIEYFVLKYKDKHRFDGPPTGKCYCVQCEYWHVIAMDRTTGPCMVWEKWTSDSETCSRGSLRTAQGYKDEKWRITAINQL